MCRSQLLVAFALAALATATAGCHRTSDAERRQSEQATAEAEEKAAEEKAQEASLTSATLDAARDEMNAAFRMEQSDYRGRLQHALDLLDGEVVRARRAGEPRARKNDLRARRSLLKDDLVAVDRSTEQDWATLRTKVERDLETGKPGAQLPPRSDRVQGEAP
jgi:hypothetical protein